MIDFTKVKSITIPEGNVRKITSNGVVVWEKATSRLPSEYQEVEYISTPNDSYINTGWIPQLGCTFFIKLSVVSTGYAFGSSSYPRLAVNVNAARMDFYNPSNGNAGIRKYDIAIGEIVDVEAYVDTTYCKNCYVICNGTEAPANTPDTTEKITGSFTLPMLLGAWYYSESSIRQGNIKLYYSKAIEGGVVKFELIPCYRKSDGVIGMYDLVSKTLFTNAGTGSFTKGADV